MFDFMNLTFVKFSFYGSNVGFQTVTFRQILWVTGLLVFPLKCAFSMFLTIDGFIIPTIVCPMAQFARFGWCMLVKDV